MSIPIKPEAENNNFVLPVIEGIKFVNYINEEQLDDVMRLVGQDLSEPYSVFTYRYFLHRWPQLCILAVPTDDPDEKPIGCVVCKIDLEDGDSSEDGVAAAPTVEEIEAAAEKQSSGNGEEKENESNNNNVENTETQSNANDTTQNNVNNKVFTGYIGMLAVHKTHRRSGIGTALVQRAIHRMQTMGCQSIRLETEVTNKAAMNLYEDRLGFVREELLKKYYLNWGDAYRLRLWLDC